MIVMSLSISSLVADTTRTWAVMCCSGGVDGATPDSGGQVGVLVRLAFEKCCADQRLERAVDECRWNRYRSSVDDLCRGCDVRSRPAVSGCDTGDGLECVPVVEPDGLGASVELVTIDRGDRLCAVAGVVARSGDREGC